MLAVRDSYTLATANLEPDGEGNGVRTGFVSLKVLSRGKLLQQGNDHMDRTGCPVHRIYKSAHSGCINKLCYTGCFFFIAGLFAVQQTALLLRTKNNAARSAIFIPAQQFRDQLSDR